MGKFIIEEITMGVMFPEPQSVYFGYMAIPKEAYIRNTEDEDIYFVLPIEKIWDFRCTLWE